MKKYPRAVASGDGGGGGGSGIGATPYEFEMTGNVFNVQDNVTNVAGLNMHPVGGRDGVPLVQIENVEILSETDIVLMIFQSLAVPIDAGADLLLGYQVNDDTPVFGGYGGKTSNVCSMIKFSRGHTPGPNTFKLMAAKGGPGTINIAASDCTSYATDQGPGGAIFQVFVFQAAEGGAGIWGAITGDIANQADLASAFQSFQDGLDAIDLYPLQQQLPIATGWVPEGTWTTGAVYTASVDLVNQSRFRGPMFINISSIPSETGSLVIPMPDAFDIDITRHPVGTIISTSGGNSDTGIEHVAYVLGASSFGIYTRGVHMSGALFYASNPVTKSAPTAISTSSKIFLNLDFNVVTTVP